MAGTGRVLLLSLLQSHYDELVRKLSRRLGSADAATEALHDAYVRIEAGNEIGAVNSPRAYLLRMATNLASNRRRADRRLLTADEIDALVDLADENPGPERAAQASKDIAIVLEALGQLPTLRRDIFLASWADRKSPAEIARRFGVHVRTVQREVRRAQAFLRPFFDEIPQQDGRISPAEVSSE
jgi:RNA polymerase sigma-70 factor (ECF subfamily)